MRIDQPSRPLKILMLAPEPFFQPRGTPISIYFRLKALSDLGHRVDLLTYHLGEDKDFPNVRILRIPDLWGIRKVRIGPSWLKIPLDFVMILRTVWQLAAERYDLVFSHEEAGWWGTLLGRMRGIPHLYDMHSSLPQQMENFQFTRSPVVHGLLLWLERMVLNHSNAIIAICPDLMNFALEEGFGSRTVLLENFIDFESPDLSPAEIEAQRKEIAPKGEKIVLYTGNFLPYQGIPCLLEAASRIDDSGVIFLLVGGGKSDIGEARAHAQRLGIADRVVLTGQVDPSQVPLYIAMADVLVSPRLSGTNTPLKIYSFLKSGKPVVATRLWTHTQVLNEGISVLAEPDPESMARALRFALHDPAAVRRAEQAKAVADREYTYLRYLEKISAALRTALT